MDSSDYDSITDAIAAVNDGGTVRMSAADIVTDTLSVSKSMTISANGATFSAPIKVTSGNVKIDGAKLVASAASIAAKNNAPVISVTGDGDFALTNSAISGTSRTGVSLGTSGRITVEGNTFEAGSKSIYNAIEFSIGDRAADISKAIVKGNTFTGTLGNNAISLYNLADGAEVNIEKNVFKDFSVNNNCVRLSNPRNVSATFNITDNSYSFTSETPSADGYTAFLLLQDYSKKDTPRQEFGKFTIHVKNLTRDGKKIAAKGDGIDKAYYVYSDQNGILPDGVNDPVIDFA